MGSKMAMRPLLNLSISSTALFLARISSSHMTMCRKSGTCTRMRMLKDLVLSGLCSEPIKDFLLMTVYFKGWDSDKEKITELITEKE